MEGKVIQMATYKSGKKAGQEKPVKVLKAQRYAQEYAYILDCIDSSGYGGTDGEALKLETDSQKLRFLRETFESEYGWNIKRVGEFKALTEWLQGLPSVCTIAFYNHDIIRLAKEWGSLPENATEAQEDKILEGYFRFMAMRILGLWDKEINKSRGGKW